MVDSYVRIFHFICKPVLLHCMTLVPFRLCYKNLGNSREWGGLGLVTWESKRVSPSTLNRRGKFIVF